MARSNAESPARETGVGAAESQLQLQRGSKYQVASATSHAYSNPNVLRRSHRIVARHHKLLARYMALTEACPPGLLPKSLSTFYGIFPSSTMRELIQFLPIWVNEDANPTCYGSSLGWLGFARPSHRFSRSDLIAGPKAIYAVSPERTFSEVTGGTRTRYTVGNRQTWAKTNKTRSRGIPAGPNAHCIGSHSLKPLNKPLCRTYPAGKQTASHRRTSVLISLTGSTG